ncbi:MAG: three-Cys-motif partner protein TcmP [Deltaproteobacteria bacterium]|nr:three-Cys-motif partner protein TcmP [Deltaproteobacteria bacterium]
MPAEQSRVKATIVAKYFWAWAKVIIPSAKIKPGRIAYIDLFAGPGRYEDGTKSTPVKIIEQALDDPDMCEMLVCLLNDKDSDHTGSLDKAINAIPGIEKMKHRPNIFNEEVGSEIVKMFEEMHLVPTLFFVDPWGYKGLSLRLVNSVLKDWGCDCIFFFNYNRINMGLGNELVREHMNALFGKSRADQLREKLEDLPPAEREMAIVEEIAQALREMGGAYVLPFCFKRENGERTSHHLIFVSKHFRGYEIMKGIMAKESTDAPQGVASFEYNPATQRQPFLFELTRPLDQLGKMLLSDFAGRAMTMEEIYMEHNVGRRFIKTNYKEILKVLEAKKKILTDPPADKRRKNTFADHVRATFPDKPI